MKNTEFSMIQGQIGYNFKNRDLLQQAFVRRSYSKECGGADNEILEFIGDKVLDIAVVRYLTNRFGHMTDSFEEYHEFYCDCTEGQLTHLKAQMVGKKSLSRRIDELGFAHYLIMGNGDIQNHIDEEDSVREDLFEAILGAVALDSNWNFEKLQQVAEIMLNPDVYIDDNKGEENYVQLIQDWESEKNGVIPLFKYYVSSSQSRIFFPFQGVRQNPSLNFNDKYTCQLKLLNDLPIFEGYGKSKNEARKNVCKLAYDWLDKRNLLFSIQDEIENPNKDDAINQLEILARRGYFSVPTYKFILEHDKNGNPIWTAECHIEEEDCFYDAVSSSKKDAKKQSAFDMLMYVLGYEEVEENRDVKVVF